MSPVSKGVVIALAATNRAACRAPIARDADATTSSCSTGAHRVRPSQRRGRLPGLDRARAAWPAARCIGHFPTRLDLIERCSPNRSPNWSTSSRTADRRGRIRRVGHVVACRDHACPDLSGSGRRGAELGTRPREWYRHGMRRCSRWGPRTGAGLGNRAWSSPIRTMRMC